MYYEEWQTDLKYIRIKMKKMFYNADHFKYILFTLLHPSTTTITISPVKCNILLPQGCM